MIANLCGIAIPDSKIAREAAELLRDASSELLFRHSVRVYFWGALAGVRRDLRYDPELLYVGAMFHDFGLTASFRASQERFEIDGADASSEFLRGHGIAEADVERVWAAIALHTTPGIPHRLQPEIALLHGAAGMDVAGRGYGDFTAEEREAVTSAYPRESEFEQGIIDEFYTGLKHRPGSTFGTLNDDYLAFCDPAFQRGNICNVMMNSPWTCSRHAAHAPRG